MLNAKPITPRDVAVLAPEDVYKELDSNRRGWTTTQVVKRRSHFGINFPRPDGRGIKQGSINHEKE
jgi:hypothetical protein